MRTWPVRLMLLCHGWIVPAAAVSGLGGSPGAAPIGTTAATSPAVVCKETWTTDRERPRIREKFPSKGAAGHVAKLELVIDHLPGEQVLPGGLSLSADAPEAEALKAASFRLPHPESEVQPRVQRTEEDGRATTTVVIPVIPLPDEAGRHQLQLPPLPIAVARASGRVQTLCTTSHEIQVEDPLASESNPARRADPPPRPQREIWTAARDAVVGLAIALPLALALLWAFLHFRKRWKKAPKPPPPIPPWQLALRQLDELEREPLLHEQNYEEYLDRVSDTLREYLGHRYGFEGLESTTRETLRQLSERTADFSEERAVRTLLQRADLVKFARRMPSREECEDAMSEARRIVRQTMPERSRETGAPAAPHGETGGAR